MPLTASRGLSTGEILDVATTSRGLTATRGLVVFDPVRKRFIRYRDINEVSFFASQPPGAIVIQSPAASFQANAVQTLAEATPAAVASFTASSPALASFLAQVAGSIAFSGVSTLAEAATQPAALASFAAVISASHLAVSRGTFTPSAISSVVWSSAVVGSFTANGVSTAAEALTQPPASAVFSSPAKASHVATAPGTVTFSAVSNIPVAVVIQQPAGLFTASALQSAGDVVTAIALVTFSAIQSASDVGTAAGTVTFSSLQSAGSIPTMRGTVTMSAVHTASDVIATIGTVTFQAVSSAGSTPISRGTVTFSSIAPAIPQSTTSRATVTFDAISQLGGAQTIQTLGSATLSAVTLAQESVSSRATLTLSAAQSASQSATGRGSVAYSAVSSVGDSLTSRGTVTLSGISTANFTAKPPTGSVTFSSPLSASWAGKSLGSFTASGFSQVRISISSVAEVDFPTTLWTTVAGINLIPGTEQFSTTMPRAVLRKAGMDQEGEAVIVGPHAAVLVEAQMDQPVIKGVTDAGFEIPKLRRVR